MHFTFLFIGYFPAVYYDFKNHLRNYNPMKQRVSLSNPDHPSHRDNIITYHNDITALLGLNFGL